MSVYEWLLFAAVLVLARWMWALDVALERVAKDECATMRAMLKQITSQLREHMHGRWKK